MTRAAEKTRHRRSHNRVQPLLDAAARLFAERGYRETTIRDIGAEVDMQAGSVYYHFKSKAELLLAVYTIAVDGIDSRLAKALEGAGDPWKKLEIAVVTHLETILDRNDYSRVMIGVTPDKAEDVAPALVALRDRYESRFGGIIDELPLARGTDRRLLRLMLLGALNATGNWYREGGKSPRDIGRSYVALLKKPVAG